MKLTRAAILAAALALMPLVSMRAEGAPSGRTAGEYIEFTMDNTVAYPGTTRKVTVFVPRQYTAERPACLLLRMDGNGHRIPEIIEELIDEGTMPVTIALFVAPGQVKDGEGNVLRYNRSNEYDRMTATWVEFVENEVIPEVERHVTSDGLPLRISRNAADRAVNGDSSGGICAFNAAWQRPDLYSRVYAIVGTFVPMRGGETFEATVRKTEPKPLRIFLQDNDKDSWNPVFGSWYEHNLLLASALEYAGYDFRVKWDEGGHSGGNGGRIMKDVLRYLWEGWPEAPKARFGGNELINSLIVEGEGWQPCAAPKAKPLTVATYPGGNYKAKAEPYTNSIRTCVKGSRTWEQFYWLHSEGGTPEPVRHLAFDTEGWLYASSAMGIQVCDHNGRVRGIICTPAGKLERFSFEGNHLYVRVDGRYYRRRVAHEASTATSPTPVSQKQG